MKTIGMLGGMSWQSTLTYYRLLNEETAARLGGFPKSGKPSRGYRSFASFRAARLRVSSNDEKRICRAPSPYSER